MVTKLVHYRKFDPVSDNWSKGTLQTLLDAALKTPTQGGKTFETDWEARRLRVQGEERFVRFFHGISIAEQFIFGTMCLFLPDDWAAVVREYEEQAADDEHKTLDEVIRQLEIAERPPADGEDYLRGIAYWLVVRDHLFVVQHTSIATKAFEEYFYDLFIAAAVISAEDTFGLTSEFNKDAVGGDLANISAVEVGGIVARPAPPFVAAAAPVPVIPEGRIVEVEEQQTLGRRVSRFTQAADVLRAVFGALNAESIIAAIPPEAELEVDVRFGYKTRRRDVSRETLQQIARAARNLPDGEVTAYGRGGGKQVGEDLRLSASMPFKLVRPGGSLLDLEDARNKLLRVYERFVEDNKIDP